MSNFLVFGGTDCYYASGGAHDLIGGADDVEDALDCDICGETEWRGVDIKIAGKEDPNYKNKIFTWES